MLEGNKPRTRVYTVIDANTANGRLQGLDFIMVFVLYFASGTVPIKLE